MEELIQHCMRELAFDGDFGCDASRFKQFVRSFYESRHPSVNQTLDDPFYTFTWRLLVQQPSVRVGTVSQGNATEVYIAPTPSKRPVTLKSKKKQVPPVPAPFPVLDNIEGSNTSDHLDPIPEDEVDSLTNLVERYGTDLRVAVDPETCFRAITGSHARPPKLSPMVYTALQFISRGRESGLSVVDLGKKTAYDQRTCFYLVQQLLALDLVVKLAQGGSGGGNFCVHKYFYTHSSFWQGVRREGEMVGQTEEDETQESEVDSSSRRQFKFRFDGMDSRHLASSEFIKSRIVRLLKNSQNGLHRYHNLLVTIGFAKPKKKDRRFFVLRIRELIKERVIEKVIVPKGRGSSTALCIRLVEDPRAADIDGIVVQPGDEGDDEHDIDPAIQSVSEKVATSMPLMNMTIHRQMLQLLAQEGSKGLTLNNIATRLGMFDRRTLELLLYRLERFPPPSHLADLTICDFIENEGRERRHRYYTLTGYLSVIHNEKIEDAGRTARYTSVDINASGGFYPQSEHAFYSDKAALIKYEREYRNKMNPPKEGSSRKIGRPRKEGSKPRRSKADGVPRPRGRPKKVAVPRETETELDNKGVKRKREDKMDQNVPDPGQSHSRKKRRVLTPRTRTSDNSVEVVDTTEHLNIPSSTTQMDAIADKDTDGRDANDMMEVDPQATLPDGFTCDQDLRPAPTGFTENIISTVDSVVDDLSRFKETSQSLAPDAIRSSNDSPEESSLGAPVCEPSVNMDTTSPHLIPTSMKRAVAEIAGDATLSEIPPSKRQKSGRPKRGHQLINISQLRAENEILRVVEESGGIVNTSTKEFFEMYSQVLSSMAAAGEPTSMPVGTQPDRRTLRKIMDNLLEHGRLKSLTLTIIPRMVQPRIAKLIYAPATPQDKLDAFIAALRENAPIINVPMHRKLDGHVDFTRHGGRSTRGVGMQDVLIGKRKEEQWDHDFIMSENDDVVRRRFLSEGQTVAQIYGYILGRVRRARELHQYTLLELEKSNASSYIVSRTERIVAFPYYFSDLPVSTYFAIVSVLEHNTELSELMKTEEGRQMPVQDLPQHLREQFKVGMARARCRLLDLLEILTGLNVVTPLQPSESVSPYISCDPTDGHPANFDLAQIADGKSTVGLMATYWRFNPLAPIYIYSQSSPWPPPFSHDMLIRTADESMAFWVELEAACLNDNIGNPMTSSDSITGSCTCPLNVGRTLRRRHSWVSSYELSYNQRRYMQRKWTNPTTGYTVLSDNDGGRNTMKRICHIISAPFDVVHSFFQTTHITLQRDAERIRRRDQLRREEIRERQAAVDKSLLARKAADARAQRESDWEKLVQRVHTAPLPYGTAARVRELRTRYIQSTGGMSVQQWETVVKEVISGVAGRRNPVLPLMPLGSRRRFGGTGFPSSAASEQPISVFDLIDKYKDKIPEVPFMPRKKRGKKKAIVDDEEPSASLPDNFPRRQRFQWTAEYDELARDASAIIRARCQTWNRMDWTALDQLFPFLPRNNVRQRITLLRQEAGGESYLHLLEEKWVEIWEEHRGSDDLPDPNPTNPSEFDIIAHVEFLRKHVDKHALLINFDHTTGSVLTENISDFLSNWVVSGHAQTSNNMDFLWSSIGDEHRENTLLGEAFSIRASDPSNPDPFLNCVAESALKMVLATPVDDYNADAAALFLSEIGNHAVSQASENLLARGVVTTTPEAVRRKTPGRNLRISDLNEDALGGSLHRSIFLEACAIEDALTEDIEKDWNVLATNGEMAALIGLVSEGKVDFYMDLSETAVRREKGDWNSKKSADDDQIEIALRIRYHPLYSQSIASTESPRAQDPLDVEFDESNLGEHGFDDSTRVPCRRTTNGIITCPSCLKIDYATLFEKISPEQRRSCVELLERLTAAGRYGLSYETFSSRHSTSEAISAAAWRLSSAENPLCYWLGYSHPVLVSWRYVKDWTVSIPGPRPKFIFPRRWINIKGERMEEIWNAALRAVVGILIIRPGISLADLRRRLVSVYDRQEVNDLLSYLLMEDIVVQHIPENREVHNNLVYEVGGVQEQELYLSMGTSAWYRIN
ncbi:hypothetical protein BU17DRAFT_41424 [Hysterangium stoloniferum]|nr:hypothetical protein BU17DRAFT_41424 [Hysterangium stoloniferum]